MGFVPTAYSVSRRPNVKRQGPNGRRETTSTFSIFLLVNYKAMKKAHPSPCTVVEHEGHDPSLSKKQLSCHSSGTCAHFHQLKFWPHYFHSHHQPHIHLKAQGQLGCTGIGILNGGLNEEAQQWSALSAVHAQCSPPILQTQERRHVSEL